MKTIFFTCLCLLSFSIFAQSSNLYFNDKDIVGKGSSSLALSLGMNTDSSRTNYLVLKQSNAYSPHIKVHNYDYSYYYEQYYKGIEVKGASCRINMTEGKVAMVASKLVPNLNIDLHPSITLEEAKDIALQALGTPNYIGDDSEWTHRRPISEKIIIPINQQWEFSIQDKYNHILAYSFIIHTTQPHDERIIYVDANWGIVLLNSSLGF